MIWAYIATFLAGCVVGAAVVLAAVAFLLGDAVRAHREGAGE